MNYEGEIARLGREAEMWRREALQGEERRLRLMEDLDREKAQVRVLEDTCEQMREELLAVTVKEPGVEELKQEIVWLKGRLLDSHE